MVESIRFADDFMQHFKTKLELDGRLEVLTEEDYRIIRLEMITAFRNGYELACKNNFKMKNDFKEWVCPNCLATTYSDIGVVCGDCSDVPSVVNGKKVYMIRRDAL